MSPSPQPQDIDAAIRAVDDLLAKLNGDLAKAPPWKRRTAWWDDRMTERVSLLRQKGFLRDRRRELVQSN